MEIGVAPRFSKILSKSGNRRKREEERKLIKLQDESEQYEFGWFELMIVF